MTVKNETRIGVFPNGTGGGGRVFIDIPFGKTLDTGELYIQGPSILKVSGAGVGGVFGKVISSDNEEASDNTCTCE